MIVYQHTKLRFLEDVTDRVIEDIVHTEYLKSTGRYATDAEYRSWQHSLGQMANVLRDKDLPDDMGVGIEFGIPQTSKRIDFLLSGRSDDDVEHVIIVELKQWSESFLSDKDCIILARRGGSTGPREGAHPSYQAWSYAALLEGFNEAVYDGGVALRPCAYLHNYVADDVIDNAHYAPYIEKAPLFLKGEAERKRLREFIKQHVKKGDNAELLFKIEQGRIRPSKMLVDSLAKMIKGNREFVLVDDQKVVFENAIAIARRASPESKQVLIIKGGPGTGKSVVAINLLVELSKLGLVGKYVSKNAAPRAVYKAKLTGTLKQTEISNLFAGSGAFINTPPNTFDVLVVDEAHRLNEKSGLYGNLGENQIKELITSANCTVFFVDDDQVVTLKDIGHSAELRRWASTLGAAVSELELRSQFRCNGSDGYIAWLDHNLGIRETANSTFDGIDFDFRVIDSPVELHALIAEKNKAKNRARVVAGYCWDWVSRRRPDAFDIEFPEHGYAKRWNLDRDGSLWIMTPSSIDEVGCIHTCQGLELDYVGVIVGPDLLMREGQLVSAPQNRSGRDRSIWGYTTRMQADPEGTSELTDRIIRNTYKTLMTRGLKGCFVYCSDAETQAYFRGLVRTL
ncbi:DNA/RNA helicase domain-containing protein [Cognatilysobacter tabacisoli]|uniref:DNA/RNA helicase domain-containing protein n=1 Tax=Cognatilysobacter tabacisoli TaxID=2315424 RepID=UPI000E6AFDA2|nr:DNA/RNA helicase domain-containing protein [Lysobacter tabacisoli]